MDVSRYCCISVSAPPPGEEDPEDELRLACEQHIRSRFGMSSREPLAGAPRLRDCDTYVVIHAEHCTLPQAERVVDWLHEHIPWVHILLIPGEQLPDDSALPGRLSQAALLTPPFGADDERVAIRVAYGMLNDWGIPHIGDDAWMSRINRTNARG